jgi:hypothetical protein
MTEEPSKTFRGGFANYIAVLSWIAPLGGVEQLIQLWVHPPALPWWASGLLILAGAPYHFSHPFLSLFRKPELLLANDLRHAPPKPTPAPLPSSPPLGARPSSSQVPDWPIRELAFHIQPTIDQMTARATFDAIGDRFSSEQLKCWGRRIIDSQRLPLAIIDPLEWQHHRLHHWLLDEASGRVVQTTSRNQHSTNSYEYTDLMVDRAQALMLWPQIAHPAEPQNPPTLLQSFETDFAGLGCRFEDTTLDDSTGFKAAFKTRLYTDHNAGGQFLSFYVPASAEAYHTIEILPDACTQIIDRIQNEVVIVLRRPGDAASVSGKDLAFTGFVYVYCPQDFDLQQQAALDALYARKGLKLWLRGPAYSSANLLRWLGSNKA